MQFSGAGCQNMSKGEILLGRVFIKRVSQKIAPRLYGNCGRAADSIISIFAKLYWSSFNVDFETLIESV